MLGAFERQPDGIGIDLFFGGGIDPFRTLKENGLLESHVVPNVEALKPKVLGVPIYDGDGGADFPVRQQAGMPAPQWYGTALSSFGILYSRTRLRELGVPEPKTWEDMTDARLMGHVGLADPSKSGSARAIYEIILQAYGWEKGMQLLTLMSANAREFYTGSSNVVKDVALGEVAEGPAIDFYGWTEIAQVGEDKLGFVLPEKLTVITPDAIAILKGAPHPEIARAFVDFVMSEKGQKLWMLKAGTPGGPEKYSLLRMPVLPSLYDKKYAEESSIRMNPFAFTESFTHDEIKASDRREVVADLMTALMIQPQAELRACWRAVQRSTRRDALMAEMTRVPVGEDEALRLAREKWDNDVFRARTTTAWGNAAVERYRRVKAEADQSAR
jgi:iron(III) transport system substrate-binding protein